MKIRSVVTGNIIEMEDEGARILIEAKIYEAVNGKNDKAEPPGQPKRRRHR